MRASTVIHRHEDLYVRFRSAVRTIYDRSVNAPMGAAVNEYYAGSDLPLFVQTYAHIRAKRMSAHHADVVPGRLHLKILLFRIRKIGRGTSGEKCGEANQKAFRFHTY